jgi:formylglycine-generating enzyme required for sulfatase activity
MERLEGETLAERLERGALGREETFRLLGHVARALDAAHKAGLVHRDLKPGNVFLESDEDGVTAKVLDFGIARSLDSAHATATEIGTPAYAAPEQLAKSFRVRARAQGIAVADEVSPATDVWAFGLIAYECLTGAEPMQVWGVESATELPVRILEEPPVPSKAAGSGARRLPKGFDAWFSQCVNREAGARFQKAGDALAALEALDGGAPAASVSAQRAAGPQTSVAGVTTFVAGAGEPTETAPSNGSAGARPRAVGPQTSVAGVSTLVPAQAVATEPGPMRTMPEAPARIPKNRAPVAAIVGGVVVLGIGAAVLIGNGSSSSQNPAASASAPMVLASAAPPASASAPPKPACPEGMSVIPAGTFQMGSTEGSDDEKPVHEVKVEAYCMDTTEVTVSAYEACVKAGSCSADKLNEQFWDNKSQGVSEYCNWGKPEKGTHPINCVDWTQATAYCGWAKKRLPTEEEWEYAAKGTDGRKYPWGNEAPGPTLLNACGSECKAMGAKKGQTWKTMYDGDDGWPSTAPVGSYKAGASPFGVLDLAGNVWEWTSSGYSKDYSNSRADDRRVSRGGGWSFNVASGVRAADRSRVAPADRSVRLGFRCARTP